ncbi:hypothetical protein Gotur_029652 [Gossypium turneri]
MLRYQWEDTVRFWNSKKGEEKLKDKRAVYEAIAQVIVLLIWTTLITELLLKFWVLKVQLSKLLNLK